MIDKDKALCVMKKVMDEALELPELQDRKYLGDDTIRLMAISALNVLYATEDIQDYLKGEGLLE